MKPSANAPAAPAPAAPAPPADPPKPANPEPRHAPTDPEKGNVPGPVPGKGDHPGG